jgi:replication initiation protein RepC
MRDNEQGKRYGRRDPETKRIIEAFGFDLSPLARRYHEFVRIAALS